MRRFYYLLVFIVFSLSLLPVLQTAAAPAAPILVETTQPDNTPILIRLHGDENNAWLETEDGYTVLKNDQGWWVYAIPENETTKTLVKSSVRVGEEMPAAMGIKKHLHPIAASDPNNIQPQAISPYLAPIQQVRGTVPTLLIFVAYEDANEGCSNCRNANAVANFDEISFNDTASIKHYYTAASLDKVTIGPATETNGVPDDGIIGWLNISGPTPLGTTFNTDLTPGQRVQKLIQIASDALNAIDDNEVDFAVFDIDGSGVVESDELALVFVLAGYEELVNRDESGSLLNPDNTTSPRVSAYTTQFTLSPVLDGKTFQWFTVVGERHASNSASFGIIAHELGHVVFGWPDLYDTDFTSAGIGNWGLMGYGNWGYTSTDNALGEIPVLPSAWSRMVQGWITPTLIAQGSYFITQASDPASPTILRIDTGVADEYFLVENRQNSGYDTGLSCLLDRNNCVFSGGLAVWHIDDNVGTTIANNVNINELHKRVDLEAATGDGELDSADNRGSVTNLYYADHKDRFDNATSPNSKLYDNTISRINLYNISGSATSMTTSFAVNHTPYFIWGVGDKTAKEGKHMNFDVTAADADGTYPLLSINGIPSGATFIDNRDGTGTFDWPSTVTGTYQLEYLATDEEIADLVRRFQSSITVTSVDGDSDGDGGGGGGCFIATAAFGSYLHPHVKTLREFRDGYLLKYQLGQELVAFYYKHSPPIAELISSNSVLRWLTRTLLTPVVYVVAYPVITIALVVFFIAFIMRRKYIERIHHIRFHL